MPTYAYTDPPTVDSDDVADAARWNRDVGDNSRFFYRPPYLDLSMTTGTTVGIPSDTNWHSVDWTTITSESDDSMFSTSRPDEIVIPIGGVYLIDVETRFIPNSTGTRQVRIRKVSPTSRVMGQDVRLSAGSNYDSVTHVQFMAPFSALDVFQVEVRQTSGVTLTLAADTTRVAVSWLRGSPL